VKSFFTELGLDGCFADFRKETDLRRTDWQGGRNGVLGLVG
jgi:hypothetical protein